MANAQLILLSHIVSLESSSRVPQEAESKLTEKRDMETPHLGSSWI